VEDARPPLDWLEVEGEELGYTSGNLDLSGADWQVQVLAPATAYIDDGEYVIHARSGSQEVQGRARLVTRQLPDGELFMDFTRIPGDAEG
jgi:hypothetical protein